MAAKTGALGVHAIGDAGHSNEAIAAYADSLRGMYATVVNDGEVKTSRALMNVGVTVIGRNKTINDGFDDDDIDHPNKPKPAAWIARMNWRYPDDAIIWTAGNELGTGTADRTRDWVKLFTELAANVNHRTCAYNTSVQNPTDRVAYWKSQRPALEVLAANKGIVGLHRGERPGFEGDLALAELEADIQELQKYGVEIVITELCGSEKPDYGYKFYYKSSGEAVERTEKFVALMAKYGVRGTYFTYTEWANGHGFGFHNDPVFKNGLIEINRKHPVKEDTPVPATLIDMQAHIFPRQSSLYFLIGAGSNETCRTRYLPSGYGYFDKNENFEEGWADEHYVYRGFDISSFRNNEVYGLWTKLPDGTLRYGNPWTPRWMTEGQIFKRTAWVIHYDASGNLKAAQQVVTWIKLVKYHATRTFASGRVVTGVAELQYGFAPDVSDVREHYFYGLNLGLVGFEDGILTTFIGNGTPTSIKSQTVIPWINALRPAVPPLQGVPTMPTIPAPTGDGMPRLVTGFPPGIPFRNIRTQPAATDAASDVGDLRVGDVVSAYFPLRTDGWGYIKRAKDAVEGWVLMTGVLTTTPEPATRYILTPSQMTELLSLTQSSIDNSARMKAILASAEVADPATGIPF